jgi:hypothetical protein
MTFQHYVMENNYSRRTLYKKIEMPWTYDVTTNSSSGDKSDGTLILTGTNSQLTKDQVNRAITSFGSASTLHVHGDFTSLADYAISETTLQTIAFKTNSKVTSIGIFALGKNSLLVTLTLPDGLLTMSDSSCCENRNMKNFTIPNTVKDIGNNAVAFTDAMTTINIPTSVETIGYGFGSGCSKLLTATASPGSNCYFFNNLGFLDCPLLEEVAFPDSLTSINNNVALLNKSTNIKSLKMDNALWSFVSSKLLANASGYDQEVMFYNENPGTYVWKNSILTPTSTGTGGGGAGTGGGGTGTVDTGGGGAGTGGGGAGTGGGGTGTVDTGGGGAGTGGGGAGTGGGGTGTGGGGTGTGGGGTGTGGGGMVVIDRTKNSPFPTWAWFTIGGIVVLTVAVVSLIAWKKRKKNLSPLSPPDEDKTEVEV